ncbi:hypothetical protein ABZV31_06280 [Streptomyces sp. NPDC005202]|uniref:hypothetical protein n=1 Tax=Streptomyces sp. NPDC005202 TaxID=3157021 RepID=UPI0033AA5BD3
MLQLKDDAGWLATGHHPDVVTYVAPGESPARSDVVVGVHGRAKRHRDGTGLRIVHVEDRRAAAGEAS